MSIAFDALSEMAMSAQRSANARTGKPPSRRSITAKPDTNELPEAR